MVLYSETKNIIGKMDYDAKIFPKQMIEAEINRWKSSQKRIDQITGDMYYMGAQDILKRKRTALGQGGKLQEVSYLPNNQIIDNQYAKMVDQKANYLLGKPVTFDCENPAREKSLNKIFNMRFKRVFRRMGIDSINGGLAWLHPYYDEYGEFKFEAFPAYEILPFWADSAHTILDFAVRVYEEEVLENGVFVKKERADIYTKTGIKYFWIEGNFLIPDSIVAETDYVHAQGKGGNWDKIPLIAFKYCNQEIPLIKRLKCLQDALNAIESDFLNNMQEDCRNTILVVKNYGGEELSDFRQNLMAYGAIKIDDADGYHGGVETLKIEVNAENYRQLLDVIKNAIIENARGYDAKDDRLTHSPNQMNIQSMYSDIDLDANAMETEYRAAFEELLWFVDAHLAHIGESGDHGEVNIIFNRDILINETEAIEACRNSVGVISNRTIIKQHPWTSDIKQEMDRIEKEKQEQQAALDTYQGAFREQGSAVMGNA